MLQRLAAVGVRGSTASELTDLSFSDDRQCCGGCCHRIRRARLQMWLFLEEPFQTFTASLVSCTMVLIIFASISSSLYLHQGTCASCANAPEPTIRALDTAFNLIFCADFAVRAWAFPMPWRFLRRPRNAIDVASVLPFLVNEVLALPARLPSLGFLKWLSAYEAVLRLLKLSRYFWGWQLLFHAISDSAKALAIPLFFLLLIVMLGSCTLYVFEAAEQDAHGEGQRDDAEQWGEGSGQVSIRNLPDAVHFSVVCILSMSTGPFYGMQAESAAGRATVCALMAFGMTFMAMPIAIVGSCFSQTWFDQDRIMLLEMVRSRLQAQGFTPQDIRDVFDEVDQNHSGEVEFCEFRTMIRTFNLRSLNATKCRRLFHYFDNDGDGVISFMDFALTLYPDLPVEDDSDDDAGKESSGDSVDVDTSRKVSDTAGLLRKKKGSAQGYIETVVVPWAQPRGSQSRPQSLRSNRSLTSRGASLKSKGGSLLGMMSMGNGSSARAAGASVGRPLAEASLSGCVPSESSPPAEVPIPSVEELPGPPELVQPESAGGVPESHFAEPVPAAVVQNMAPDASIDSRLFSQLRWSCTSQGSAQSSTSHLMREDRRRDASPAGGPSGARQPLEAVLYRLDRLESQLERRLDRVTNLLARQGAGHPLGGGGFLGRTPRGSGEALHANRSMPASARASRRPSLSQPLARPAPPPAGPSRLAPPRSKPRTLIGWSAMQEPAPEGPQASAPRPSQ